MTKQIKSVPPRRCKSSDIRQQPKFRVMRTDNPSVKAIGQIRYNLGEIKFCVSYDNGVTWSPSVRSYWTRLPNAQEKSAQA